jgi:hypothetical protein
VANRIAEALGTQAQSIETASTTIVLTDGEPLGFVTPTNWNQLPVLVREFIRKADIRLAKDNYVFTVAYIRSYSRACVRGRSPRTEMQRYHDECRFFRQDAV